MRDWKKLMSYHFMGVLYRVKFTVLVLALAHAVINFSAMAVSGFAEDVVLLYGIEFGVSLVTLLVMLISMAVISTAIYVTHMYIAMDKDPYVIDKFAKDVFVTLWVNRKKKQEEESKEEVVEENGKS